MNTYGFRIGDRVANNDPLQVSYNWHGVIKSFHKQNPDEVCWVDWQERKAKDARDRLIYKQSCITSRMENLRRI